MSDGCAIIPRSYVPSLQTNKAGILFQAWPGWVASVAVILWCVFCRVGFTLETYPWFFPDSYDWITNGLAYANPNVAFDISHRGLLFTLIMALLYQLGLPDLIVLVGTCSLVAVIIVLARGLARLGCTNLAASSVVILSLSHPFLSQSAFVGSDVLACVFLTGLTFSYLRYVRFNQKTDLFVAAAWAGFGIHSQYIEVVWLPILGSLIVVEESPAGFRLNFGRLGRLILSPKLYQALAIGTACAFSLVIPRLLVYEVIYSPKVTHLPLVSPNLANFKPYAVGLVGQLGLVVCLLAVLGALLGLVKHGERLVTLGMVLWVAVIGGFFVFLYTWYDCRFAIYIGVPIAVLAARGIRGAVDLLANHRTGSGPLQRSLASIGLFGISLTQLVRPDSNMFSDRLLIAPNVVLTYDRNSGAHIQSEPSSFLLINGLRESRQHKSLVAAHSLDSLTHSQPVADVFHALRGIQGKNPFNPPPIFLEALLPDQWYYVKNRNVMYFGSRVDTLSTVSDAVGALRDGTNGFTVGTEPLLRKLFVDLPTSSIVFRSGNYIAVDSEDLVRQGLLRKLPPIVSSIEAEGDSFAVFDGIVDNALNYSSSPLGKPITIRFEPQTSLASIELDLFDFDARRYCIAVTGKNGEATLDLYRSPPECDRGKVLIKMPASHTDEIQIVGISNSDTETNPANTTLHIKEIRFNANG